MPKKKSLHTVLIFYTIFVLNTGLQASDCWTAHLPSAQVLDSFWVDGDWTGLTYVGVCPWLYSSTHGWLYPAGNGWFYDLGRQSWIWTGKAVFPFVFSAENSEWIYYLEGSTPERRFFHFFGNTILPEHPSPMEVAAARSRGILHFATGQHRLLLELVPEADKAPELFPNGQENVWKIGSTSSWISGFFPASLWLHYLTTGDAFWKTEAERRLQALESQKTRTSTHDIGFMVGLPFSIAYDITGTSAYRDVVRTAAGSLSSRFSLKVGATRSWSSGSWDDGDKFTVIIDNMMNLELLLRGSAFPNGSSSWSSQAKTHALTSLREHVRPNGSTYHVVVFDADDGLVKSKQTAQGLDTESTWSRGQAWAVHGYALMYEYTQDAQMREAAIQVARYFIDHLPESSIPPWDFDVTGTSVPTDTSAGAIAAAGLLRLSEALGDDHVMARECREVAARMLIALSRQPYLAVGSAHGAVLLGGSRAKDQYEQSLIYGDYYLLEACYRLLGTFPDRR